MKSSFFLASLFGVLSSFCACSWNTMAARSTAGLLDRGMGAFYDEADPEFARAAMPGQLKLLESLLRSDPDNLKMLAAAAEGFGGYAFLFLEDSHPERARNLYLRGRDYGLRRLTRRAVFSSLSRLDFDAFKAALGKANSADAPALFWTAFNWAGFINLSKDSPAAVLELPKAAAMMARSGELAPQYHFAGADIFCGVYYASRPKALGGDTAKAKACFEQARVKTGGHYLMIDVLEARALAVAEQNIVLFRKLLTRVLEEPAGTLPNARLADEVAKQKAKAILEKTNDYF